MKVLKGGNKTGKWVKKFVCKHCDAVLEVCENDLFTVNTAVAYAGETWDPRLRFTCPVCSTDNDVTNNVPYGIQFKSFSDYQNRGWD